MDHANLDPDMCKCSRKELPTLIADWSKRAIDRVALAVNSGAPIDMGTIKHEAQLVASIARQGPAAFAQQNAHYGHFCDECPYRRRTPLSARLTKTAQAG